MEVKKITEGMTAPQVAQVIDDNFKAQNAILEEDITKQNNVIGVSEYKDFSEAEAVNVGDVRKYNGLLYECVKATTGAFDASKWKKSSFKNETEKKLSELGSEVSESIIANLCEEGLLRADGKTVDLKEDSRILHTKYILAKVGLSIDEVHAYSAIKDENGDLIYGWWYDENFDVLSKLTVEGGEQNLSVNIDAIPSNAKYIRFNILRKNLHNISNCQIVKGGYDDNIEDAIRNLKVRQDEITTRQEEISLKVATKDIIKYESVYNEGYINIDGIQSVSTNYKYTNPIELNIGDSIICYGFSDAPVSVISKYEDGKYTNLVGGEGEKNKTYSYVAVEKINVVVSSSFIKAHGDPIIYVIKDPVLSTIINSYNLEFEDLKNKTVDISYYIPSVEHINGKYVSAALNYTDLPTSTYRYTKPILLKKNDEIILKGYVDNIVSAITLCDKDGNLMKSLCLGIGEDYVYSYITREDCYVILSYARGKYLIKNQPSIAILDKKINELENSFNGSIDVIDPNITQGFYVGTSNNIITISSGSYSITSPIFVPKGKILNALFACQSNVSAISITENIEDVNSRKHTTYILGVNQDLIPSEYEFKAEEDCYVEISFVTKKGLLGIKIREANLREEIEKINTDLAKTNTDLAKTNTDLDSIFTNSQLRYYALNRVFCLGDSLTSGAYYANGWTGASIDENYPRVLGRILNTEVTNGGYSGYSASDWFTKNMSEYDFSKYDSFVIWLGTNNGLTDTLDEDVNQYDDYNDFALTETGYYCKIIEYIKEKNSNCIIALGKIFASKGNVETTNKVIEKIAEKYGLLVVDFSDMHQNVHPEWHGGVNNTHLGKAGNIEIAKRITEKFNSHFVDNPLACEFGVTNRKN